jgi:hypothetical protein
LELPILQPYWNSSGLFLIIGLILLIVGLFFAIFMIANAIIRKTTMNAAYIAPGKASYEIDNLSNSLNNTDRSRSWRIISRLGYWFLVRPIFRSVHPGHKMLVS